MLNRRAMLAGIPVVAAVPLAGVTAEAAVPSPLTRDEAARIVIGNMRISPLPHEIAAMVASMNLKLFNRYPDLFDAAYVMKAPVDEFHGIKVEARTRKLSVRMTINPAMAEGMREALEDAIVEGAAEEFRAEMQHPKNRNTQFCPYMLMNSSGVMLDPTTFDPIVCFHTRYGTFERA